MSQDFVQFVGAVVVAAVTVQVLLMLATTVRRYAADNEANRLSLEVLRLRADTALANHRRANDTAEFGWNGIRKFEVDRKVLEVDGVHSFYLLPHDGKKLPPFLAGQFLTFELSVPGEMKPVIRCYSLSDSPHKDYYRVSIKKIPPPRDDPGGRSGLSSTFFNDVLQQGDIVNVKAPAGHFHLQPQRNLPIVLIGGGIGITPIMSMLNTLCDEEHRGEVWFFLGVRNSREHAMKENLEAVAQAFDNVNLRICYSNPLDDDVAGRDYHHTGYVGVDLFKEMLPSNNYVFYICGPPPMMESLTSGLYDWGVPEERVHFEAFGMATVKKAAKPDGATGAAEQIEYAITFERSGKTLTWTESEGSVLDLAEKYGLSMNFACRTGNCGTCMTAIKEGDVDYLVKPGYEVEKGSCLACIGIPKGALKLDA